MVQGDVLAVGGKFGEDLGLRVVVLAGTVGGGDVELEAVLFEFLFELIGDCEALGLELTVETSLTLGVEIIICLSMVHHVQLVDLVPHPMILLNQLFNIMK